MQETLKKFDLHGKTALITGGAGLLGPKHAEALLDLGADVVLTDIDYEKLTERGEDLIKQGYLRLGYRRMDVTDMASIQSVAQHHQIDILINNAALDPKVKKQEGLTPASRFETMTFEYWQKGMDAILNGAFLCSQVFGRKMAERGYGVILNIGSDITVAAPNQNMYKKPGIPESEQNVKPACYHVAKYALWGLTPYLAAYWGNKGVRVNCLSPGGVYMPVMPDEFRDKYSAGIPLGRMANPDDYKAAVAWLCSDASAYLTGQNIVVNGGRNIW